MTIYALLTIAAGAIVLSIATGARADDDGDWEIESSTVEEASRQRAGPARQASAAPVRAAASQSAQPFTACGEQVVPAVGPIKAVE